MCVRVRVRLCLCVCLSVCQSVSLSVCGWVRKRRCGQNKQIHAHKTSIHTYTHLLLEDIAVVNGQHIDSIWVVQAVLVHTNNGL